MEIGHQEALWPGCMAHSYKSIFKDRINRTEGGFMLGNVRKKFIGNKQFYKMVLAIAIPIMIQNGITNFVSLLDNIMVGQIGTEQMVGGCDCQSADLCIQFVYLRRGVRCGNLYRAVFWTER